MVRKLKEQESLLSQARKLFVIGVLKLDDYSNLKDEYQANSRCLKKELRDINKKIGNIERQSRMRQKSHIDIFQVFPGLDATDKRHLVNIIPPLKVDFQTGYMTLGLNNALSKIIIKKNDNK